MHRRIVLLAVAALVVTLAAPAVADNPPVPDFPTGDLWSRANNFHVQYDVADVPEIKNVWGGSWAIPWGAGLVFDRDGYMYIGADGPIRGLWIYDKDPSTWAEDPSGWYAPVGLVPIPEGEAIGELTHRWVDDTRQTFSIGTYDGRMYVFDTTDVTTPQLLHIQDLNHLFTWGWGGRLAFDADGYLWATGWVTLHRFLVDDAGYILDHEMFNWIGGNPTDLALEEGTDRLFYAAYNADYISIRDRLDPWTELARITDVCGIGTHNPGDLVFNSAGDLFVICSGSTPDETDVVKFPGGELQDIAGIVNGSSLEQVRFSAPSNGGGWLAFRPAIGDLIGVVQALDLEDDRLQDMLLRAGGFLTDDNKNNDGAAIGLLTAFIGKVGGQMAAEVIPEADGEALIAAAQQIIDMLSG